MQKICRNGGNIPENKNFVKICAILFIISVGFLFFPGKSNAATLISQNSSWNSQYLFDTDTLSGTPGLIWSALATNSVETIIFKLKTNITTKSVGVVAYPVNCADGANLAAPYDLYYFGSDRNSSTNVIDTEFYSDYSFTFPNPLIVPGGMCVVFAINNDRADFAYLNTGGMTGFSFATSYAGGYNYQSGLPYFSLWEGFFNPEIQIDDPPADFEINELPLFITWTATADNDNTIIADFNLYQSSNSVNVYTNQRNLTDLFTPYTATEIVENICNGDYIFSAIITDRTTGYFNQATRSVRVSVLNNPFRCGINTDFCADFTGTFDEPFCKVVKYLFVPDNISAIFKNTQQTINDIWVLSVASSVYHALDVNMATSSDISYSLKFGTMPTISVWNTAWLGTVMTPARRNIIEPYIEVFLWAGFGMGIVAIALKLFKK